MFRFSRPALARRLRKGVLLLGAVGLLVWLVFFDSHSLLQRWKWTQELERLQAENAELVETIERLEADLEEVESEEVVEKVAREQYGMRREGETVYRVQKQEP